MRALNVPVINQWGLRPAVVKGTKEIALLTTFRDLDKVGLLNNVTTFNFHLHLPHYEVTAQDAKSVHVLARQLIDPDCPHPSQAPGTKSSIVCSGCRRTNNEPVTFFSSSPPTSPRSSAAPTALRTFGEIWL
jgi:hypothetical protein